MNLLLDTKNLLTSDFVSKIAENAKEKPESTKNALEILIPTLLLGLTKRTSSEGGANLVFNILEKEKLDGSFLQDLKGITKSTDSLTEAMAKGNSLFSRIMPDKKSSITNMIAHQAGVRASSSISLLGLATPIVLDALGKMAKEQNLDAHHLALQLAVQKDHLVESTPKPLLDKMADILGINNLGNLGAVAAEVVGTPTKRAEPIMTKQAQAVEDLNESSGFKIPTQWWIIGGAVLVGAVLIWFLWKNFGGSFSSASLADSTEVVNESLDSPTPLDTASQKPVVKPSTGLTLPDGQTLAAKEGSLPYNLSKYLADTAAVSGRQFVLEGSFTPGTLTLTSESEAEMGEVAKVLKAYPSAQLRLTGYVRDSIQSKTISFKRANAIKSSLMAKGIDLMRLDAVGKGRGNKSLIELKVVRR